MSANKPAKDPAKARFLVISLFRWFGVALVLIGILISAGRIDLPVLIGPVLILLGLFEAFVMPRNLARKWKSPEQ
jgi:hypothetical protein